MSILVIGNGFDLAHDLPTGYPHFLTFLRLYVADDEGLEKEESQHPEIVHFIKRLKDEDGDLNREVHNLLGRMNILLAHFQHVYEKRCLEGKKGWVDFESEIAQIIQLFEKARGEQRSDNKYLSKQISSLIAPFISAQRGEPYSLDYIPVVPGFFEMMAGYRYEELNTITRLLEIYLAAFVNKLEYIDPISQIANLPRITHVLSFNYTNTYQRLYGQENTRYCYIHGKAEENGSVDTCNLVLGIDEYLEGEAQNKDNAFIWFKKFYQRIYKETSSVYIDWLEEHCETCRRYSKDRAPILDIYFYGHSLDVTDKDVLEKLILHEYARIYIFYRNKAQMAKQIANLVKIIGEEKLIRMTRGANRTIIFKRIEHGGAEA